MLIETPVRTYRILRVLKEELSLRMYLAADRKSGGIKTDAPRFLMIELINPVLGKNMMRYLTEFGMEERAGASRKMSAKESEGGAGNETGNETGNGAESGAELRFGLLDCFVRKGVVWAVFPHHEGRLFREAAHCAGTVKERVMLWQGVLERMFYQKIPAYLRYEASAPGNLVVDEHSVVWANYELHETDRLQEALSSEPHEAGRTQDAQSSEPQDALFSELQKRLYESFCILFADELTRAAKRKGKDAAAEYAERLRAGSFENERALCRSFYHLRTHLPEQEAEQDMQEKGILLRLWNTAYGHADKIWKCGYLLLVLGLWVLFLFLCIRPESAPAQRTRITAIGTVELEEQAEETEEQTVERDGRPMGEDKRTEGTEGQTVEADG